VVDSLHDVRLSRTPIPKGLKNNMAIKVPKGAMNGTTHVGESVTE
jgi:hypothetical protein